MTEQEKKIVRLFPSESNRVETGVVQFGEDWPGIFIRGDDAMKFISGLTALMRVSDVITTSEIINTRPSRELLNLLQSCILTPSPGEK